MFMRDYTSACVRCGRSPFGQLRLSHGEGTKSEIVVVVGGEVQRED